MAPLIIVLIIIIVVNVGVALILSYSGRKARDREERLTREAAKAAIEKGVARVRGEAWVRSHKH